MTTYWVRYSFPAADVTYRRHMICSIEADSLAQAALEASERAKKLDGHKLISVHSADDIEDVVPKPFF